MKVTPRAEMDQSETPPTRTDASGCHRIFMAMSSDGRCRHDGGSETTDSSTNVVGLVKILAGSGDPSWPVRAGDYFFQACSRPFQRMV